MSLLDRINQADEMERLLQRAHDLMDDSNAVGRLADRPRCQWCGGLGYDADGLIHKTGCILTEIRRLIPKD